MAIPSNATRALPILLTTGRAFRLLWSNRDDFLRLAAVPVFVMFLISLVAFGVGDRPADERAAVAQVWSWSLLAIPDLVLTTLFSVGWLRVLLLRGDGNRRDLGLRWTRAHTLFLGRTLLLCVGIAVAALLFGALIGSGLLGAPLTAMRGTIIHLALLAATLVVSYASLRLSLVFPATAIGHPYGFAASWRDSRRHGGQLLVVSLLLGGGVLVAYLAVHYLLFRLAPFTTLLLEQALSYVFRALMLTTLAIAFHRLSRWGEAEPPANQTGTA